MTVLKLIGCHSGNTDPSKLSAKR